MVRPTIIGLLLSACACFSVSRDEVARASSPSGRIDAVLIETNGGATTTFVYFVYLVPRGAASPNNGEVARLVGATRNDQAWGADLRWGGGDSLAIEYREAKDAQLRTTVAVVGTDTVRLALKNGVVNPSAPAGGMLINLPKVHR